jgi:PglZ domain
MSNSCTLGSGDTFSCQERIHLQGLVRTAADGDLTSARSLLATGERSVWRRDPERALLWQVVQRCVTFLELAAHAQSYTLANDSRSLVEAYVAADGLWKLDRAQRLYEYAVAQCAHDDSVEPLVQRCRVLYRTVVQRVQAAFQTVVQREGWPPEGMRRQTQTFDSYVTPELALRHKIAYFLVDSLRYEMGRDLAEALQDLGSISIESAVTVLPTTTPCGMAALLPGADGAFAFVEHCGELIPTVGGTPLPGVNERKALLAERYGDRYLDATMEDLLSMPQKTLGKRIGQADLLVVRTQDIDALGEGPSLYRARRVMSEVISELRTAAGAIAGRPSRHVVSPGTAYGCCWASYGVCCRNGLQDVLAYCWLFPRGAFAPGVHYPRSNSASLEGTNDYRGRASSHNLPQRSFHKFCRGAEGHAHVLIHTLALDTSRCLRWTWSKGTVCWSGR